MRKFFGVGLQVIEEALEFMLHSIHLFTHVQDDLNTREIHPEIAGQ